MRRILDLNTIHRLNDKLLKTMTCNPHLTVAAIIEEAGRYLMVEEISNGKSVLNQPAGHWEAGETGLEAVVRETLEETCFHFTPTAITGFYSWVNPQTLDTYLRVSYTGILGDKNSSVKRDQDITNTHWLSLDELRQAQDRMRSPLVLPSIQDYANGTRYDLSLIQSIINH